MLLWLLIVVLPSAHSLNCSYMFDGTRYARQELLTVDGYAESLQLDPTTNDLIYGLVDSKFFYKGSVYILRNGTPVRIDIDGANVAASDFTHNRVFIGTHNGIKLLNSKSQASMDIPSFQNITIASMFKPVAEDKLLTISATKVYELDLNTFEKSQVEAIPDAWNIAADTAGNIFYVTPSREYRVLLKGFKQYIQFVGLDKSHHRLRVDDDDRVIAIQGDGLYWLRPDSIIPKKLMDLDISPRDVVFDCNDIYVSSYYNTIYKFSNKGCQ